MRINLTLTDAEQLAEEIYQGSSKPLSRILLDNDPQNPGWWLSQPKNETFYSDRHQGALDLYLEISGRITNIVPRTLFPAVFEFTGGETRRPDKGFIKMCLSVTPALLSMAVFDGELLFYLARLTGRDAA